MSDSDKSTHRQSMLEEWQIGSRILANGHYDAAKRDTLWNDILGATVIAATAIVGSAIFASLGSSTERGWQITAGVISMTATLLAAEQKYLRLEERATQHREAGRVYQALRQDIEVALTRLQDGASVGDDEIASLRTRRDEIEKTAPTIPNSIYERAKEAVLKCK
ncbi:MAG: SLATT domain-containing protein [Terracidiphilus sp.]